MRQINRFHPKLIERPDQISILIPTRGRPQGIHTVFQNYQETVGCKELFDVWLYVDDDDQLTLDYIMSGNWRSFDFSIHWHIAPGKHSMGEMFNELWQVCSTNPGIYLPFVDDYVFVTSSWDIILRDVFSRYDDNVILGYFPDKTTRSSQVTLPVVGANFVNTLGYYLTNKFYFWFDDSWLDEISQMAGRKVLLPIQVTAVGGKGVTPRLRNLLFWSHYFFNTLHNRYLDANHLIETMYANDSDKLNKAKHDAIKTSAIIKYKYSLLSDQFISGIESACRDSNKIWQPSQLAGYMRSEMVATAELADKLSKALNSEQHQDALEILTALSYSNYSRDDISYLRAYCLDKLDFVKEAVDVLGNIGADVFFEASKKKLLPELAGKLHVEDAGGSTTDTQPTRFSPASWMHCISDWEIYFSETIDEDLFFVIQHLILTNQDIKTVIDVRSDEGKGSVSAVLQGFYRRPEVKLFSIGQKPIHLENITTECDGLFGITGLSVALEEYISEKELKCFYNFIPGIMNFFNYSIFSKMLENELKIASVAEVSCIAKVKEIHAIESFDLAILDGSFFTGVADLRQVYGARYIVLNSILSIKNYSNFIMLSNDKNYRMLHLNKESRCGYAVFAQVGTH